MSSRAALCVVLAAAGCASSPDASDSAETSETEQALTCGLDAPGALASACEKAAIPVGVIAGALGSQAAALVHPNLRAYGVHLVAGGGQVEIDIDEPGTYQLFLGTPNIAFRIHDFSGHPDVAASCTTSIAAADCQYLRKVRSFELAAGHYLIELGPSTVSYVRLFVQSRPTAAPVCVADALTEEVDTCDLADGGSTPIAAGSIAASGAPELSLDTIYTVGLDATGAGAVELIAPATGSYELYLGTPNLPLRVLSASFTGDDVAQSCTRYIPASECAKLRRGTVLALRANDIARIEFGPHPGTRFVRLAIRASTPPAGALKLGAGTTYDTGQGLGASYVTAADLDGDGAVDLVASVANDAEGVAYIAAMENAGDGSFTVASQTTTSLPFPTVAADFEGDGITDIAGIAWDGQGPLSAFYLRGTGGFAYTKSTWGNARDFQRTLASADFDEDGTPDLLATWTDSQGTSGLGGFVIYTMPGFVVAQDEPALGDAAVQAVPGDFDGDGHQDVAIGSRTASLVKIYRGDGSGHVAFAFDVTLPGAGIATLGAVDFDGDGRTDLVATHTDNTITVSRASGTGFASPQILVVDSVPFLGSIGLADLDHDGSLDLVVSGFGSSAVVYTASPTGFARAGALSTNGKVAIGDFNNDGLVDLATANVGGVTVYLGTP